MISKTWDNRTRFVVYGQAFLFLVVWAGALGRLIQGKFWNAKHNVEMMEKALSDEETPKDMVNFIEGIGMSYYTNRYHWFFPHVAGSIIWWNLYFLQLIPSIRNKYKKFHRVLGRVLMVCAFAQAVSGVGLAYMGNSPTIKIISSFIGISAIYCLYYAWYYAAIEKDIAKHKYWAMRLVGYLQSIALQRVFMLLLIVCHKFGLLGLYPASGEEDDDAAALQQIFDDSFVCCYPTAVLLTEWYLAGYYGWTESKNDKQGKAKAL